MSFLIGGAKQPESEKPVAAAGVTLQTSCYGKVLPVVYGTNKLAPNCIWYGAFQAIAQTSSSGGGGKGGGGGGGSTTSYVYKASFAFGLCEGPVAEIGGVWVGSSATAVTAASLGGSGFLGELGQAPWSYLASFGTVAEQHTVPVSAPHVVTVDYPGAPVTDYGVKSGASGQAFVKVSGAPTAGQYAVSGGTYTFTAADAGREVTISYTSANQQPPSQALSYSGLAYLGFANYDLGSSASMPNHVVEVYGFFADPDGALDANPRDVVADILTDPVHGLAPAFDAGLLDAMDTYAAYAQATGLLVSPVYTAQQSAAQAIDDLTKFTNADVAWTGEALKILPRGDEAITANGATYTPQALTFALTDADLVASNAGVSASGSSSTDPLVLTQTRPEDAVNVVTLEYLPRANAYNPEPVTAIDLASVQATGRNGGDSQTAHMFADGAAARLSAQLILQRAQLFNAYQGTYGEHCVAIDIGDTGTITNARHGLATHPVRVKEITEQADGSLLMVFEDYAGGAAEALAYGAGTGYASDYNVDPGAAAEPILIDAPVELATSGGLEVWLASYGGAAWAGAQVYVSSDGETYMLAGTLANPGRIGTLASALPESGDPDTDHTLSVDLSASGGTLLSGTRDDADAYHTLCWVDGELLAYQTAELTGPGQYDLSYLRRGAYGTAITTHAEGARFLRVEEAALFRYPYTKDQIGQTISIKLVSYNHFGSEGLQDISDVSASTHTLVGPPLPDDVAGFSAQQSTNVVVFKWRALLSYALKGYDIAYGPQGVADGVPAADAWAAMQMLTEAARGTEMTNASVPPGDWTFAIRARDVADQLSPNLALVNLTVVNAANVIAEQTEAPYWAGDLDGLLEHYTGVLVPDSTKLASAHSKADLFERFVPYPVDEGTFTGTAIDTQSIDLLRIWAVIAARGRGGEGAVAVSLAIDTSTDGADWSGVFQEWSVGTVMARYVHPRLVVDASGGACVVTDMTTTIDTSAKAEFGQNTAAPGGTAITFSKAFHQPPNVQVTATGAGMTGGSATDITATGCIVHGWIGSTDTGGSVSWRAEGP